MTKRYLGPVYPTEAHGKIPAFHSIDEEAFFWDTHNVTDYELMDLEDMAPFVSERYLKLKKANKLPF